MASFRSSFRVGSKFVLAEDNLFIAETFLITDIKMLPYPCIEVTDSSGNLFKTDTGGYVRVHSHLAFKLHPGTSAKLQQNGLYYPVEVRADFPYMFHHVSFWKRLRGKA